MYTVEEAYQRLKDLGLTSSIQVVRRWIREGQLQAEPFEHQRRKEGYRISDEALQGFIEKRAPGIAKLLEENENLKRKQNKGNITKEIIDDPISTLPDPEELRETIQERYQKALVPFAKLTEEAYQRTVYSAASLLEEVEQQRDENKALQERLAYYKTIVEEKKTDPLERKILKALGVSIQTLLKDKHPADSVTGFHILKVEDQNIDIRFSYHNQRYTACVRLYNHPAGWSLIEMRKVGSSKRVQRKTMDKIEYDCLEKTFERLYRLEQHYGKGFQYLYNLDEYQLNHF